jgi:putative copper export protein
LLVKIGLFIAMLCVAAVNRRRLTPRLSSEGDRRPFDSSISQAIRQLSAAAQ